ncbi:MAG: type II toxin-antitoxin system RelE/ParE family toxin [Edaphobacter sp.]
MPEDFVVTPRARIDLRRIWQYIAADNPRAADDVEAAIYRAFDLLSNIPSAGHWRRDLTVRPLRFWPANPYENYLIIYDPQARPIRIIRVVHAALDAKLLLK